MPRVARQSPVLRQLVQCSFGTTQSRSSWRAELAGFSRRGREGFIADSSRCTIVRRCEVVVMVMVMVMVLSGGSR